MPPQPLPTPSSGLSSARERRRQRRKEVGKRRQAVLRTRSSSDLLYNVENSSSSDSTPAQSPNPSASSHSQEQNGGVEDTDGPLPTTETVAAVHCVDSIGKEVTSDGGIGLVSGSSSSLEDADGGVGGNDNGEGDMEEVYTLLDSTLHTEAKVEEEDGCSCRQGKGREEGRVSASLHPGRLKERIAALRRYYTACYLCVVEVLHTCRECEARLGRDTVATALSSLNFLDPEADPVR